MNPGTHPYTKPRTYHNVSLAEPTYQQVEIIRETPKAVLLAYRSDSCYGQGDVEAWFPRKAVRLEQHPVDGLIVAWTAPWIASKLASGDHSATLCVGG